MHALVGLDNLRGYPLFFDRAVSAINRAATISDYPHSRLHAIIADTPPSVIEGILFGMPITSIRRIYGGMVENQYVLDILFEGIEKSMPWIQVALRPEAIIARGGPDVCYSMYYPNFVQGTIEILPQQDYYTNIFFEAEKLALLRETTLEHFPNRTFPTFAQELLPKVDPRAIVGENYRIEQKPLYGLPQILEGVQELYLRGKILVD